MNFSAIAMKGTTTKKFKRVKNYSKNPEAFKKKVNSQAAEKVDSFSEKEEDKDNFEHKFRNIQ